MEYLDQLGWPNAFQISIDILRSVLFMRFEARMVHSVGGNSLPNWVNPEAAGKAIGSLSVNRPVRLMVLVHAPTHASFDAPSHRQSGSLCPFDYITIYDYCSHI